MTKILIIDDDKELNDVYCEVLNKAGYEATGTLNAKDGILKLNEIKPDVLFLDLKMPEMDGIEFLIESKIKTEFPDTTVIVFTASSDPDDMVDAYMNGANSYVLKVTLQPEDLVEVVQEALEG